MSPDLDSALTWAIWIAMIQFVTAGIASVILAIILWRWFRRRRDRSAADFEELRRRIRGGARGGSKGRFRP